MAVLGQLRVAVRLLLEMLLDLLGLLNLRPLFAPQNGPKRLAFQAYSVHLAQFYRTLLEELADDEGTEVTFIVLSHPHFSSTARAELKAYAREELGCRVRSHWQVRWECFDTVVYTDVYARFPLRARRNLILMHGPGLTRRVVRRYPFRKTIFDFDLVLASGEFDARVLEAASRESDDRPRILAAGFPYLDDLDGWRGREAYLGRLGLDADRKTILLAPSWIGLRSLQDEQLQWYEQVIAALREMEVNILIKPHACSLNPIMAGGVDWSGPMERFGAAQGIAVDVDVDDIPALASSDALITDLSSRAFNFMLLGRPVVLYFPSEGWGDDWDARRFEFMRKGSVVATAASEIGPLVDEILLRPLNSSDQRTVAGQCFSNYGNATEIVAGIIREPLSSPGQQP